MRPIEQVMGKKTCRLQLRPLVNREERVNLSELSSSDHREAAFDVMSRISRRLVAGLDLPSIKINSGANELLFWNHVQFGDLFVAFYGSDGRDSAKPTEYFVGKVPASRPRRATFMAFEECAEVG